MPRRNVICSHSEAIGEDIMDEMSEGWIPEALSCFAVSPHEQKCCVLVRKDDPRSLEWIPGGGF